MKQPNLDGQFDDTGMTQEFVVPWNRVSAQFPDEARRVKGIRTNPALQGFKIWAQIAPDGYLEVNPGLAQHPDIDAILVHELKHAAGGDEAASNAAEHLFRIRERERVQPDTRPMPSHLQLPDGNDPRVMDAIRKISQRFRP